MSDLKTRKNSDSRELLSGSSNLDHQELPPPYQYLEKEQLPQGIQSCKKSHKDAEPSKSPAREGPSRLNRFIKNLTNPAGTKKPVPKFDQEHPRRYYDYNIPAPIPFSQADYPRHKYFVKVLFVPPEYQSDAGRKDTPWIASLRMDFADIRDELPRHIPWRANLNRVESDDLDIDNHPLVSGRRMFQRHISSGMASQPGSPGAWILRIDVWHRDSHWLAGLARSELGNFISLLSAVRAESFVHPSDDFLESEQLFYVKFFKSWHPDFKVESEAGVKSTRDGIEGLLEAHHPRLCQLLDDHLERHIRRPDEVDIKASVDRPGEPKN